MSAELFDRPLPLEDGIYRAIRAFPDLPLAQRSNAWTVTARLYEPLWRQRSIGLLTGGGFSTAQELALMVEWLGLQPLERVLDAACSAGLYARTLLASEPSLGVHALDLSLPFLQRARRYAAQGGVSPVLVWADVRALPYQDAAFDAVVCGGSLNEFTDPEGSLREMARVLRPGARLWLMYLTPAPSALGRSLQALARASGIRFFTPQQVTEALSAVGLERLRAQAAGVVAFALYRKR